jgi:hypothetical protein
MAFEVPGLMHTAPASTDLSASQYCFVNINTSGQLALPSNGAAVIGVLQNKPNAAGIAGAYMVNGVSKVVAGGTIAAGAQVTTNGSGQAIAATTGLQIHGRSVETASASTGQIISVELRPGSNVV